VNGAAEVYLAMVKAVHAGDREGVRAALPPGRREMVDSAELEAILGMLRRVTPRQVEVVGVEERGERAVVTAEGVNGAGERLRGEIRLQRGGEGEWWMAGETWGQ
jgi:hypothetical protein